MLSVSQAEREASEAADFVAHFAEGWARGARGDFFGHFAPRFHDDALFEMPLAPAVRGAAAMRRLFEPLFAAMPDLHGEVLRWGETHDGAIVELRLRGTFGGRPIEWTTLDVLVLRDGKLVSRTAHFDPLPLLAQMVRRPMALARLLPGLVRR